MYFNTIKGTVIARPTYLADNGLPVDDAYLADNGIYPILDIQPSPSPASVFTRTGYAIQDEKAVAQYSEEFLSLVELKEKQKVQVTALRYSIEVGGLTINGVRVATDDRSKALINGAYNKALRSINSTFRWKADTGFITLTAAEIIAIGEAVFDHVQACFDREMELLAQIDGANDIFEVLAISIETGWPGE